jgi:hypothetical protein
MAQVEECLKHEALSSKPSTTKKTIPIYFSFKNVNIAIEL